ncbi:MAG: hypothetical protein K8T25_12965 [Planctomycetia bacterium]|nr:hypothetical protein [Planctomycetia bacterium]
MVIKLRCPQGHQVVCPDDKVGQSGKCPRCGSAFVVPSPPKANGAGPVNAEELIVFLCPNGHKLNGPASLQGRPGQCPHCNARFVIPDYNEPDDADDEISPEELSRGDTWISQPGANINAYRDAALRDAAKSGDSNRGSGFTPPRSPEPASGISDYAVVSDFSAADGNSHTEVTAAAAGHPMADMLERLWLQREHGAIIEVQLRDGTVLLPDRISHPMNQAGLLLIAARDSEGGQMVSAVAWDAIVRVSARRLQQLPRELFK